MLPCWGVHPTRVFMPRAAVLCYHLQTMLASGSYSSALNASELRGPRALKRINSRINSGGGGRAWHTAGTQQMLLFFHPLLGGFQGLFPSEKRKCLEACDQYLVSWHTAMYFGFRSQPGTPTL